MELWIKYTKIFMALMVLAVTNIYASTDQGAFITQSDEGVSIDVSAGEKQQLLTFSKLYSGTKIYISENSKLQIIYLSRGTQESWAGPAEIVTGETRSSVISSSSEPVIKSLPPYMVSVLIQSNEVITDIKERQGMIRVRSLMTARKIKEVKGNYAVLRENAAADDISPEIYLLTVLDNLKLYEMMKQPLNEIMVRQPDNQQAKELHDQFMAILDSEKEKF